MSRFNIRRFLFIIILSATILLVLAILLISPITKFIIEKNDKKYFGREITMDWSYINPLTGYIYFKNLKIYEPEQDSIFLSSKGLSVNLCIYKLFQKKYEITEIVLNEPRGTIIQIKKALNFDDIIKLFSPKKSIHKTKSLHLSIHSIRIKNGEFYFRENEIPINYCIKKANFDCNGFRWNSDTTEVKFSFLAGKSGSNVNGSFTINYKTLDYGFSVVAQKFDLDIINQYMKPLVNFGTFRANVDADLKAKGNFHSEEDITTRGTLSINNLHFGKDSLEDYFAFDKLVVDIKELSPKYHKYLFDSLRLSKLYFKYERYDHMDNLEAIFGKEGSNITVAKANTERFNLIIHMLRYSKVLWKNFFKSAYKINKLLVIDGHFEFNDYSLSEKFSISAIPFYIFADSLEKSNRRAQLSFKSELLPYGSASINLSFNPNDSGDFEMNCHLQKIPATLFNPYLISYTSYSLDKGTVEFTGNWKVRDGLLQSTNHLLILDPSIGGHIRKKGLKWEPMPLLMAVIRERGNVIDYEIPITGNLKNPKFHFHDVLIDLAENILIKPPTIPYGIHVTNTENAIEKSLSLKWNLWNATFQSNQEKFIKKTARFLKENPEASLLIQPINYDEKEKEQILFFEAKKKYFLTTNNKLLLTEKDSLSVEWMSVRDSAFVQFLNKRINSSFMFTMQEKCSALINPDVVIQKYDQLKKRREKHFRSYFVENGTDNRINIKPGKSSIPYDGFSYYKIDYKGDVPESLLSAYVSLQKMNSTPPRKKYLKERKRQASLHNN